MNWTDEVFLHGCPRRTASRSATPSLCPHAPRHTERGALCPAQSATSRSATPPLGEYFMLRLLALRAPLAQHDSKGVGPGKRGTRHTERGALCPAECTTSRSATTHLGEYFMLRLLAPRAPLAQHDSRGVGPGKRSTRHTERGALCPAECATSRSATTPHGRCLGSPHASTPPTSVGVAHNRGSGLVLATVACASSWSN